MLVVFDKTVHKKMRKNVCTMNAITQNKPRQVDTQLRIINPNPIKIYFSEATNILIYNYERVK